MSSREKNRGKHSKDSKHTSKSTALARPKTLSFLWSIQQIESIYDDKPPRFLNVGGSKGNDIARFWFPNNRAKYFKRHPGNIYRWRMGQSQKLDNFPRPKDKFEVASVFFQARQDNFVAVLRDCTREDISEGEYGWSQICFNHRSGMSLVDVAGEAFLLAAPADGSSWMPQVLPEVYNYDTKSPSAREFTGHHGGLCGKLSLLIGMAAFSAEERNAEAVVSQCFGFGEWRRHQFATGIGRYENRGVLVSIYLDPDAEGVTSAHLRAFEKGDYGPIFATYSGEMESYTTGSAPYSHAVPRSLSTASSGYPFPSSYNIPSGSVAPGGYSAPGFSASNQYPLPSEYSASGVGEGSPNLYDADDNEETDETNN